MYASIQWRRIKLLQLNAFAFCTLFMLWRKEKNRKWIVVQACDKFSKDTLCKKQIIKSNKKVWPFLLRFSKLKHKKHSWQRTIFFCHETLIRKLFSTSVLWRDVAKGRLIVFSTECVMNSLWSLSVMIMSLSAVNTTHSTCHTPNMSFTYTSETSYAYTSVDDNERKTTFTHQ